MNVVEHMGEDTPEDTEAGVLEISWEAYAPVLAALNAFEQQHGVDLGDIDATRAALI